MWKTNHFHLLLTTMLAIIASLAITPLATARDAPLLPAPIGSAQLERLADRLELSDAQRTAWRRSHLEYQRDHRERREDFMNELQPLRRDVGHAPFDVAEPRIVRRFYNTLRLAMDQLLAIDRELFDTLKPHLADEQRERLPALIAQRTGDAWRTIQPLNRWWRYSYERFYGDHVDLHEVLDELDLDQTSRHELLTIVDHHTIQIAQALIDLSRRVERFHHEWARRVAAETDGEEPSRRARAEPYIELSDPSRHAFERVLRYQHDALLAVLDAAEPATAWKLFVAVADEYSSYIFSPPIRRFDRVTALLRDADSLALEKEAIEQYIATCRTAFIEQFDVSSRFAIEQNSALPPGMDLSSEQHQQLRSEREQLVKPVQERVEALIPHVENQAIADMLRSVFAPHRAADAASSPKALSDRIREQFRDDLTPDDFLPGPISRDFVRAFADTVNLSDDKRQVLDMLHQDYQRAFMSVRRNDVEEVVGVFVGFRIGESGMGQFSPPEDVTRKHQARIAARKAIDQLDRRFISDVALAVLEPEAAENRWMLELLRAGEAWTRGSQHPHYTAGHDVAYRAEPLRAVLTADIDRDKQQAAIDAIAPHAPMLTDALRELFEAELELQYARDRMTATMRMENREEALQEWQSKRDRAARLLRITRRGVIERSFDALDAIEDAVSLSAMQQILESFLLLAYPSVYGDDDAQHDRFLAALALESVSGSQRDRLTDAWLAYQQAYREVSWSMVEAIREPNHFGIRLSAEDRTAVERAQHRVSNLRLERQQINDQAALAIETVLTGAQREAIAKGSTDRSNRAE